jgi:hypothetical protein
MSLGNGLVDRCLGHRRGIPAGPSVLTFAPYCFYGDPAAIAGHKAKP